jgi:uncharacterized repeat protein (TIGR03837 family)
MKQKRWDIFCRIVDNYGDIGVTWRLARQLAAEHEISVRLWIDDLTTAGKLIRSLNPELACQIIQNVEICVWGSAGQAVPADVVVEAFACELPSAYLDMMAAKQPVWINLEYLSAEPWVAEFHARSSRHPTLPLTKYFFFPGFESNTGGLLREQNLLASRDHFRDSPSARQAYHEQFRIPDSEALKVSLFCYPHAPVVDLMQAFAHSPQPILCLVPESGISPRVAEFFNAQLKSGTSLSKGNLTLLPLPFLSQDDYDRLLWLCDINFVRGEDSWVRAIWAGKPLVWQPYRQQENTHLEKLAAFLNVYCAGLDTADIAAVHECHVTWCSNALPEPVLRAYLENLPLLNAHAASFAAELATESDLASKLVIFCGNSP